MMCVCFLVGCFFFQRMVNLLVWGPAAWIPKESPKMKGIVNLGCTPIRIPNYRDPNQQLIVGFLRGGFQGEGVP